MSKQHINQSRKQGQGGQGGQASGKLSNSAPPRQGQASGKPTTNNPSKQGQMTTKPGQMPSKGGMTATARQQRPANKPLTRQGMKQERRLEAQQRQAAQQRAARTRRVVIVSVIAAVICVSALVSYLVIQARAANGTRTVFDPNYPPVDGVYCDQLENLAFHHHVHLTIFIDGNNVPVSQGIGIANGSTSPTCYYWLHTHATDGIIHMEAPYQGNFTLKNILDVWQNFASSSPSSQISYPTQLASSAGWTVYINGKKVNEDFSKVDISSDQAWHEAITIMYNSPNSKPDTSFSWPSGY